MVKGVLYFETRYGARRIEERVLQMQDWLAAGDESWQGDSGKCGRNPVSSGGVVEQNLSDFRCKLLEYPNEDRLV